MGKEKRTILDKMSHVIVHSYIYYVLNSNVISDSRFDTLSKEVATLIKEYPESASEHRDYKLFKDFDGSTGYSLVGDDPYWLDRASIVMWSYEQNAKQKREGE